MLQHSSDDHEHLGVVTQIMIALWVDGPGILKRLVLKGVGGIALSPIGHVLAAWVPEAKGVPGFVGLWDHRQLTASGDAPTALSRKSFFRVCARASLADTEVLA